MSTLCESCGFSRDLEPWHLIVNGEFEKELSRVLMNLVRKMNAKTKESRKISADDEVLANNLYAFFERIAREKGINLTQRKEFDKQARGFYSNPFMLCIELYNCDRLTLSEFMEIYNSTMSGKQYSKATPSGLFYKKHNRIFGAGRTPGVITHELIHYLLAGRKNKTGFSFFGNEFVVEFISKLIYTFSFDEKLGLSDKTHSDDLLVSVENFLRDPTDLEIKKRIDALGGSYALAKNAAAQFCESVNYDKQKIAERILAELRAIL